MTVTSTNQKVQFNGNGSTTVFAYNFKIFASSDLSVILRSAAGTETVQQLTTNYTVSGVGEASGGNVTMGTAPPSGTTLTILRVQPNLQGLDLVPNDPFPAGSMEDALDKLTFMVQTHDEEIGRSIKASKTNVIADSEFTVSAADRANKLFSFDSSGNLSIAQELGTYRGDWSASTGYAVRDLVKDTSTGNIFICITAHTSSGSEPITTNTDAAKWALIVDAASATTSASTATTKASEAAASATLASQWAIKTDDTVDGTNYSAKYWATRADVGLVAGKATEIGLLGNSTTITNMNLLGTSDAVSDMNTLGTSTNVTNQNTLAGIASNITTVAGIASDVTAVAADATDIGAVAGKATEIGLLGNSDTVADLALLGTAAVVEDMGLLGTTAVVEDMGFLGTAAVVEDMGILGTSANVTAMSNVSGSISNVNTVASNISGVNDFAARYRVGSSDPSSNNDDGDLFYNTTSDALKVYNAGASAWQAGVSLGTTPTFTSQTTGQINNTDAFPDIRPSLLLDFANSKTLDPRITFTRGSTATYYDGKTTAKAEENLLKYSQELDNAAWFKGGVTVTANNTAAPDGTTTADQITADGATADQYVQVQYANMDTSSQYTLSIWLKTASGTASVKIGNISAGSYSTVTVTDSWQRFTVTQTPSATTRYPRIFNGVASSVTVYAWGAQLEQRSAATAYTPTTSSPIVKYQPALQTAASGAARFDHSPTTGESKGLLIEEARTNLLPYSEAFDNAAWNKSQSTVTSNSIIAPNGTQAADTVTPTAVSGLHNVSDAAAVTSGTTYTFSVYAKANGYSRVTLDFQDGFFGASAVAEFNLQNGTIATASDGTDSITDVGNGWYRITSSCVATSSGDATFYCQVHDGTVSFTGDGYSGVFFWGAQLEAGSFPTSYIATAGSTVTRATDSAKITGANLSGSVSDGEGTLYAEVNGVSNVTTAGGGPNYLRFGLNDNNYVSFTATGDDNLYSLHVVGGSTQENYYSSSHSDYTGNTNKAVIAFSLDQNSAFATQPFIKTDQTGWVADGYTTLAIGGRIDSETAGKMSGTIKKIAYYPKRLSNATLQAMTSE